MTQVSLGASCDQKEEYILGWFHFYAWESKKDGYVTSGGCRWEGSDCCPPLTLSAEERREKGGTYKD